VLAARAALDTHRSTIEVLHLMGATDTQVRDGCSSAGSRSMRCSAEWSAWSPQPSSCW
jgi:hypothetical protein